MSKYLIPIKYYFTPQEDANNVNITSTTDTSSSEYKSESKGFFSSSTTKQEKQTSKNIASLLQANNVNIETGNLTLIASKIKANEAQITAENINLISSKESEYESNNIHNLKRSWVKEYK
ncbi:MAG: hypothetical protein PHS65_05690 [Arcobacteraceae bacterium]|nr:hypothetical protein [Arcobacteraceae bacterium]